MIPSLVLSTLLFAASSSSSASQSSSLIAAAAASGRPPECAATLRRGLSRKPTIWEIARAPELSTYCDLIARAKAELGSDPKAAKASAIAADKALPGYAAPKVLLGRAALALGKLDEASRELEAARALDPRSVEDPPTMHDLAIVLRKTGKLEEALIVYRALVPRIDLLGPADRRITVLLEAAHVSMAVSGIRLSAGGPTTTSNKTERKAPLDEAVAYLREARQRPPTALTGDVLLSLVLVLDRNGDRVGADAALADAVAEGVHLHPGVLEYLAIADDKPCIEALAETGPAAIKLWETYLAGPSGKGPWAQVTKTRLEAAKKAPRPPTGKTKP